MIRFTAEDIAAAKLLAPKSLHVFTRYMFARRKGYRWRDNWHHKVVCDALMRVYRGECTRLIINIPPRYSKTEIAVINFMAWCLGNAPDCEFIHTCYSGKLAANNAWHTRALVQHPAYTELFPDLQLRADSQARDEWRTTADGIVYAVGVGGTITGFGAGKDRPEFGGAIIIDDPLKPDDARSDAQRKGGIEWYQDTLESRQNAPGRTPIIVIAQRLHENDLSGWLLAGGSGEQWEHISLPALRDDGTALWPHKHSVEQLKVMRQSKPYTFAGQYQQQPAPPEGNIFKPGQMTIIDALPAERIRWVRGWDLASLADDGDWTAGGKLGQLPDGRYVIADMVRVQEGPDARDRTIKNTASLDGKGVSVDLPQDPGQAGKTQVLAMTRLLAGHTVHASPESGDKVVRAEPFAAQVNVGNVLMLRAGWNEKLVDEMRNFPNGANDDQVDALSRAFARLLSKQGPMRISNSALDKLGGTASRR